MARDCLTHLKDCFKGDASRQPMLPQLLADLKVVALAHSKAGTVKRTKITERC